MSGSASFSWTLPEGPPLTEEQRALVGEAFFLAPKVAYTLAATDPLARRHIDDMQGVACEGFVRAVWHFDASRGGWLSYAYAGALMRCRAWLTAMRLRETHELDAVVCIEDGDEVTHLDVTPDPALSTDELLARGEALALVDHLPARERLAIQRYFDDATLEAVGAANGLSREAVRRREVAGIERIRARLGLEPLHPRQTPAAPPPDADDRLRELLSDGIPRTARDLAAASGYAKHTVYARLRSWGAVQVGTDGRTALWTIPCKDA